MEISIHPVTAVINVRNGEVYIEETLQSLLRQTVPVNILVVDNQSTDTTRAIVARHPTVRLVSTPESMTLGAARAFSLNLVESEIVGWIDSDDLWDPTFAERVGGAVLNHPTATFATAGTVCIDPNGKIIGHRDSYHRKYCIPFWRNNEHRIVRGDTFSGIIVRMRPKWAWCAHLFRTQAVREVGGFDVSLQYSVDLDLIAKLLRLGEALHVPANLTRYRRHPAQDTQKQKPEVIYGEKLLVTRRLGQETGLVSPPFARQMAQVTEMKCRATYFFRERTVKNALAFLRTLFSFDLFAYYWRLAGAR